MSGPPAGRRAAGLILGALLAVQAVRVALTWREFSATIDESGHIGSGVGLYQWRTFVIDSVHPPLARYALGLPPYLAGIRLPPAEKLWDSGQAVLQDAGSYWKALTLGRMGNLVFLPVVLYYVYRWAFLLYGRRAALAAAVLIAFSPNMLAQASVATTDLAAGASIFAAAFHFWRWAAEPGWGSCLRAGVAAGVAAACKFSALAYLPVVLVVFFVLAGAWRPPMRALRQGAVFLLLVFLVVWAAYQFQTGRLSPDRDGGHETLDRLAAPGSAANRLAAAVLESRWFPAPAFVWGVHRTYLHATWGHPAILLGERRQYGWWYYFPVVIGVKSTIPFLLLAVWAGAWVGPSGGTRFVAAAAGVILAVAMCSTVQIGVRHILALYPLLAVLAGSLFAAEGRRASVAAVLLVWHAGESLWAHPDYLAYFNQVARGREERFLSDSNLDWGQDLARLGRHVEQNRIRPLHLRYFGRTRPDTLGMDVRVFGPEDRPTGWVAISVAHLQGLMDPSYEWLRSYQPRVRIGKTILLYYLPAEVPAGAVAPAGPQPR